LLAAPVGKEEEEEEEEEERKKGESRACNGASLFDRN
jgi:ribosomal protein L12E/L44/L45/RPP1/RPP2